MKFSNLRTLASISSLVVASLSHATVQAQMCAVGLGGEVAVIDLEVSEIQARVLSEGQARKQLGSRASGDERRRLRLAEAGAPVPFLEGASAPRVARGESVNPQAFGWKSSGG